LFDAAVGTSVRNRCVDTAELLANTSRLSRRGFGVASTTPPPFIATRLEGPYNCEFGHPVSATILDGTFNTIVRCPAHDWSPGDDVSNARNRGGWRTTAMAWRTGRLCSPYGDPNKPPHAIFHRPLACQSGRQIKPHERCVKRSQRTWPRGSTPAAETRNTLRVDVRTWYEPASTIKTSPGGAPLSSSPN